MIGLRSSTVIVVPPAMAFEYLGDPETVPGAITLPSRARVVASDPGRRLVVEADHGVHGSVWTFDALSPDETELTVAFRYHLPADRPDNCSAVSPHRWCGRHCDAHRSR